MSVKMPILRIACPYRAPLSVNPVILRMTCFQMILLSVILAVLRMVCPNMGLVSLIDGWWSGACQRPSLRTSSRIFSELSPRIANRTIVHRGWSIHVRSTHPNALRPRFRAIWAGMWIQKMYPMISAIIHTTIQIAESSIYLVNHRC